eukprot:4578290-Amphidinium_carterae.1
MCSHSNGKVEPPGGRRACVDRGFYDVTHNDRCQGRTSGRASIASLVAIRGFTTAPTTMVDVIDSGCIRQQCHGSAARGPRPCQSCGTYKSPAAHAMAEGLSTATTNRRYVQAVFSSPAL